MSTEERSRLGLVLQHVFPPHSIFFFFCKDMSEHALAGVHYRSPPLARLTLARGVGGGTRLIWNLIGHSWDPPLHQCRRLIESLSVSELRHSKYLLVSFKGTGRNDQTQH